MDDSIKSGKLTEIQGVSDYISDADEPLDDSVITKSEAITSCDELLQYVAAIPEETTTPEPEPGEIVLTVDDSSLFIGSWQESDPDNVQNEYARSLVSNDTQITDPELFSKWTWKPVLPEAGKYYVYVAWSYEPYPRRSSAVKHEIITATESKVVHFNQRPIDRSGKWQLVGFVHLNADGSDCLVIGGTAQYNCVDACKFRPESMGPEGTVPAPDPDPVDPPPNPDPEEPTEDFWWKEGTHNSEPFIDSKGELVINASVGVWIALPSNDLWSHKENTPYVARYKWKKPPFQSRGQLHLNVQGSGSATTLERMASQSERFPVPGRAPTYTYPPKYAFEIEGESPDGCWVSPSRRVPDGAIGNYAGERMAAAAMLALRRYCNVRQIDIGNGVLDLGPYPNDVPAEYRDLIDIMAGVVYMGQCHGATWSFPYTFPAWLQQFVVAAHLYQGIVSPRSLYYGEENRGRFNYIWPAPPEETVWDQWNYENFLGDPGFSNIYVVFRNGTTDNNTPFAKHLLDRLENERIPYSGHVHHLGHTGFKEFFPHVNEVRLDKPVPAFFACSANAGSGEPEDYAVRNPDLRWKLEGMSVEKNGDEFIRATLPISYQPRADWGPNLDYPTLPNNCTVRCAVRRSHMAPNQPFRWSINEESGEGVADQNGIPSTGEFLLVGSTNYSNLIIEAI